MVAAADAHNQNVSIGGPFRRVLVAWDGSPDAIAALKAAAALVGDGPGHVVALAAQPAAPRREAEREPAQEAPASMRHMADAFQATKSAIAEMSPVRIDLHTANDRHAASAICDYALEHGFDLLVIGRHGDGGLRHPRLGHVAEAAARNCKVPVLLVSAD
ncbi:MAG: universal stress protein [Streptosporangiaceae bacterium]